MRQSHVELRRGAYADSVTLMQVSRTVQGVDGVAAAQVAMATELNLDLLPGMGFDVPAEAGPNDLVVAIRLDADGDLGAALAGVDAALGRHRPPRLRAQRGGAAADHGSALRAAAGVPAGAVALVSVPGP